LWDHLLASGKQVRAVGGSDYHCPAGADTNLLRLGQPTTWVQVKERSHQGIFDAIQAGRTSISAQHSGPRIALTATIGGGAEQAVAMGEAVTVAQGAALSVTATVWDGGGFTVQFIVDGVIKAPQHVTAAEQSFTLTTPVATYIRAELIGDLPADQLPADAPTNRDRRGWRWALSNPIFISQGA
ncbi:MAG: CehA/McbA family metallohydrolase, partial [Caldilineaceae bacterium]|nr:CehA/McbA family metallohydrolase [Caldilineaceae bacterium]